MGGYQAGRSPHTVMTTTLHMKPITMAAKNMIALTMSIIQKRTKGSILAIGLARVQASCHLRKTMQLAPMDKLGIHAPMGIDTD